MRTSNSKLISQKDLLSITAHDLRTPLQTILGYVEMIIEEAHYRDFDLQNGGYVSLIQKNAFRLQSLIEKIMDIAKIESRSLVPNRVSVEINQEIDDIIDEYRSAFLNTADMNNRLSKETIVDKKTSLSNSVPQSVTIKFIPSKEILMVNIDRLKTYQVVTNLLNNSLKSVTKKYDQLLSMILNRMKILYCIGYHVQLKSNTLLPRKDKRYD
ncbi:MAG: HAMP domain-containing histidine kinase [Nitrosopumilus sp.]|nr:HAMP domain-containing histidine kinase [Nitrosopumilus sp.]